MGFAAGRRGGEAEASGSGVCGGAEVSGSGVWGRRGGAEGGDGTDRATIYPRSASPATSWGSFFAV